MKNKIAILILFACSSCLFGFGQNKVDSTAYYLELENSDFKKALEYCISDFNKWNLENYHGGSVIGVKISKTDLGESVLTVSQIFTMSDIFLAFPNNYSYVKGRPILWMMERSYKSELDSTYQMFLIQHFLKYVLDDMVLDNYFDSDSPNNVSYKIKLKELNLKIKWKDSEDSHNDPVIGLFKKDSLLSASRFQPALITLPIKAENLVEISSNYPSQIVYYSPKFIIKMNDNVGIFISSKGPINQRSMSIEKIQIVDPKIAQKEVGIFQYMKCFQ